MAEAGLLVREGVRVRMGVRVCEAVMLLLLDRVAVLVAVAGAVFVEV